MNFDQNAIEDNYVLVSGGGIPDDGGGFSEVSFSFTSEATSLVEFDAMSSSEEFFDFLTWSINGEVINGLSGIMTEMVKIRFTVPAGENVLTFRYEKDEICCSAGNDLGAVDNLLINNVSNAGKINLSLPELPEGASYYSERDNRTKKQK